FLLFPFQLCRSNWDRLKSVLSIPDIAEWLLLLLPAKYLLHFGRLPPIPVSGKQVSIWPIPLHEKSTYENFAAPIHGRLLCRRHGSLPNSQWLSHLPEKSFAQPRKHQPVIPELP